MQDFGKMLTLAQCLLEKMSLAAEVGRAALSQFEVVACNLWCKDL